MPFAWSPCVLEYMAHLYGALLRLAQANDFIITKWYEWVCWALVKDVRNWNLTLTILVLIVRFKYYTEDVNVKIGVENVWENRTFTSLVKYDHASEFN